jgi:hypothetical protein
MLGKNEVRLKRIYVVHAGDRSTEQDLTPNWNPNAANPEMSFDVILEAEAGEDVGDLNAQGYVITASCINLMSPAIVPGLFPVFIGPFTVGNAGNWEKDIHTGEWSRQWVVNMPIVPANEGLLLQYFVTMRDPTGNHMVASFAASEPFLLD